MGYENACQEREKTWNIWGLKRIQLGRRTLQKIEYVKTNEFSIEMCKLLDSKRKIEDWNKERKRELKLLALRFIIEEG
ncbi:MAG: hypothetical protein COA82_06765 [Alkaliphilus sp.]|nr:hypothetical protein [bacterium AH-315-L21]PHS34786.1 MAG: hypothetical protein COA82_06765 [Alkaliphilus sp.]